MHFFLTCKMSKFEIFLRLSGFLTGKLFITPLHPVISIHTLSFGTDKEKIV